MKKALSLLLSLLLLGCMILGGTSCSAGGPPPEIEDVYDRIVEVMKETGHDIPSLYKETSTGGIAKIDVKKRRKG